jgi:hypothetical protein
MEFLYSSNRLNVATAQAPTVPLFNDDLPVFSVCKQLLATDGSEYRRFAPAFA